MVKELFKKIKEYETIIIHRHTRPDLDALGSQRGLALVLRKAYPQKKIYMVGDMSNRYAFLGEMDQISDEVYQNSLVIIVDVAVSNMVSDSRYLMAKEVFVIDHHKNECDITKNVIKDDSKIACAELITELLLEKKWNIPSEAATALYGGIVTDSGRFQYQETTGKTLAIAGKLLDLGADKEFIYKNLYTESLEERQLKNWFANRFETTEHGVAYLKNGPEIYEKFNVDFFNISRGMVGVMAGIKEISIWCNFTYDPANNTIVGEFRSRDISIVHIAKKYGGGGHDLACGATLNSFEEADLVIKDMDRLLV